MPLAPGPFVPAPNSDVAVTPGIYDFTADALTLQGQMNAIGAGWDSSLLDIENFAQESADVAIGVDLVAILSDVTVQGAAVNLSYLLDIDSGWTDAGMALNDALGFAPPQAWSDPGEAFVPPDSALIIAVPNLNPAAYVPAPNLTVGASSAGAVPSVGLFNTTRYGSTNFAVGDQFEIVALGKPGDEVVVSGTFNGTSLGTTDYGQIDGGGQFFLTGTMGPEVVGVWSEQWYIAGALLASFNFVVAPS